MTEYVAIDIDAVLKFTAKAILFGIGDKEVWIPKSVIEDVDEIDDDITGEIFVAEWFAEQEGLI